MVYARVPDAHLETAVDVMTDMVFAPTFAELDSEREVVLEEIAMYEDTPAGARPRSLLGGRLRRPAARPAGDRHARGDRERQRVARSPRTTARCTSAATSSSPPRATSSTTSSSSSARARAACGDAPPKARVRGRCSSRRRRRALRFQRKDTEQYHVCLGAPGISRSDRRRFAASLLDSILGGSASSRLFQEIREKRGMAYAVYSFTSQYTDTGLVGFYVGTREENLAACLEIVARADRRHRRRQPAAERAAAREGEPRRGASCSRWSRRRTA